MNTELLNLSLRLGYRCEWSDKMISFPEHDLHVDNLGRLITGRPINIATLNEIIKITNKWLELQKIGAFKE